MANRDAERWLALEFVTTCVVRTIAGFREQGDLLGPQNYAAIIAAYAMLSMLVLWDVTADLAAVFGALLLLAVLLRPTADGSNLGRDTARSVQAFTEHVGSNPPSVARGAAITTSSKTKAKGASVPLAGTKAILASQQTQLTGSPFAAAPGVV